VGVCIKGSDGTSCTLRLCTEQSRYMTSVISQIIINEQKKKYGIPGLLTSMIHLGSDDTKSIDNPLFAPSGHDNPLFTPALDDDRISCQQPGSQEGSHITGNSFTDLAASW